MMKKLLIMEISVGFILTYKLKSRANLWERHAKIRQNVETGCLLNKVVTSLLTQSAIALIFLWLYVSPLCKRIISPGLTKLNSYN